MNLSPLVSGAAKVAMFSAAFAIPGTGIAYAGTTSGNGSVLGGNQVSVPVSVPVNVCGNAVALLGVADAGCKGGAAVVRGDSSDRWSTSGNGSVGGGNQVSVPVSVPVNVCGNAAAVLGKATAKCRGGAAVTTSKYSHEGSGPQTSGNGSVLGGNQVGVPVSVPVNVCGNALALLGVADAKCRGGAAVTGTYVRKDSDSWTSGKGSVGGGNQVSVPVSVPVNVCGNAVNAQAKCRGGAKVSGGHEGSGPQTSGNGSVLGGNQVGVPVSVPVNVCGNAVALLGVADAKCRGGAAVTGTGDHEGSGPQTSGNGSVGGGNQVSVPVSVPVNVCGNAAAVLGKATAKCRGGSSAGKPTPTPTTTTPTPPSAKHHHHGSTPPSSSGNPPSSGGHNNGGTPPSGTGSHHHPDVSLTSSNNGLLPTTGADLAGLLAIALGAIAAGAVSLFAVRRRRLAGRA